MLSPAHSPAAPILQWESLGLAVTRVQVKFSCGKHKGALTETAMGTERHDFQSNTQVAEGKNQKIQKFFYCFCCNGLAQSSSLKITFFSTQTRRLV